MTDINETDAMDMNEASTHYRDGHAAGMAVGREQIGEREATIAELQAEVEALTKSYASLAEGQDELVAETAQLKRDLAAAEELAMNESMKHSREHLRAERAEAELARIRPVYDAAFVAVDQSRNRSVQQRPTRFPDLYRAVDDARSQEAQDA